MTNLAVIDDFGTLVEPATVRFRRRLPGPIERVWSFLTESQLRSKWLAAGTMKLEVGAEFELVWQNDTLTNPPGQRPEGFGPEHRMKSRIIELAPPKRLTFTWGDNGDVSFELEPDRDEVLLTLIHRRLRDRSMTLMVGAGWHMHLDILAARVGGKPDPAPFWDGWLKLKDEYDRRLPV